MNLTIFATVKGKGKCFITQKITVLKLRLLSVTTYQPRVAIIIYFVEDHDLLLNNRKSPTGNVIRFSN